MEFRPVDQPSTDRSRVASCTTAPVGCRVPDGLYRVMADGLLPWPRFPRRQGRRLPSPARAAAWPPGHATTSQGMALGGGILTGRITPRHPSWRPHLGQRSGWASPRAWHAVCQSSTAGGTTGPCPRYARQMAKAIPLVGAYNPEHRTTRVPGGGPCSRYRRINSSMDRRMRPGRPLVPPTSSPFSRSRKVTTPCAHATSRWLAKGPPRI